MLKYRHYKDSISLAFTCFYLKRLYKKRTFSKIGGIILRVRGKSNDLRPIKASLGNSRKGKMSRREEAFRQTDFSSWANMVSKAPHTIQSTSIRSWNPPRHCEQPTLLTSASNFRLLETKKNNSLKVCVLKLHTIKLFLLFLLKYHML